MDVHDNGPISPIWTSLTPPTWPSLMAYAPRWRKLVRDILRQGSADSTPPATKHRGEDEEALALGPTSEPQRHQPHMKEPLTKQVRTGT
jgi:hypothetical protein